MSSGEATRLAEDQNARLPLTEKASFCPSCHIGTMAPFYRVQSVPVHSVVQIPTRQGALDFPKGDLVLALCPECGFVSNTAYDPSLQHYCSDCEETQGFSPTFQEFQRNLVEGLIQRHELRGKRIIEIGCGKGEFLTLLCELGHNTGIGFDPAFVPDRNPARDRRGIDFVQDFYSEQYTSVPADFIACKMTLEHIANPGQFIAMVRRSIGNRQASVFFQVPDFTRVLQDRAFWDIYYEHCSYFTAHSLNELFQKSGFNVETIETHYDGQYLTIEATPGKISSEGEIWEAAGGPAQEWVSVQVLRFAQAVDELMSTWRHRVASWHAAGQKTVLWGSGSKGVSFLSALEENDAIHSVVDINPHRQGMFMPGSGHEIVAPSRLSEIRPDFVIAMNSVYREEIQRDLNQLGLSAKLYCL